MKKLLMLSAIIFACDAQIYRDFTTHECVRECKAGEIKFCQFSLHIEKTMCNEPACRNCINGTREDCSAPKCNICDGRKKPITTFNKMLPGPTMQVCKDDIVIVDVTNDMSDAGTAIHWRGLLHKNSQFMDGAPMITQPLIPPHTTFRYNFKASEVGTHIYQANPAIQQADGGYGVLFVKRPLKDDAHSALYERDWADHIFVLSELFKDSAETHLIRNKFMRTEDKDMVTGILLNGVVANGQNSIPANVFDVNKDRTYKFKVVHAGSEPSMMEITVQGHELQIIECDGSNINPIKVDTLRLFNGERCSFVLNANQNYDQYVIQVHAMFSGKHYYSYGLLKYRGSRDRIVNFNSIINKGKVFPCTDDETNCVKFSNISGVEDVDMRLYRSADIKHYIDFDLATDLKDNQGDVDSSKLVVNGISMTQPTRPLLLNPRDLSQHICNENNKNPSYCNGLVCKCVHIRNVPLNQVIELILVNQGRNLHHPYSIEIHGYQVHVTAMGKIGNNVTKNEVKQMYESGAISNRIMFAPRKNTITVPNGGYVIVKFISNNPGYWLVAGNMLFQTGTRFEMVLKVGEIMPIAPRNFPRSGDYFGNNMFL